MDMIEDSKDKIGRIYILLPVYNRYEQTQHFVNCLKAQTYQNYHLVLIDDGSTDGTEEMVRLQIQQLTVIKGRGDWWWAGGLQQGIEWLKSQQVPKQNLVLMINDDVSFEPNFIEKAIAVMQHQKEFLLCAQSYGMQTGKLIDAGIKADLNEFKFEHAASLEDINCFSTMGLFLRVADILSIGDFRPKILPHYLSDYEYTIRAFKKGFRLHTCPEVRLLNNEETTGPRYFKKESNFFKFAKKYFSKRSAANPIYFSVCVVLICPKRRIPIILLRIWWETGISILKQLAYSCIWHSLKLCQLNKLT